VFVGEGPGHAQCLVEQVGGQVRDRLGQQVGSSQLVGDRGGCRQGSGHGAASLEGPQVWGQPGDCLDALEIGGDRRGRGHRRGV
jgi:hypothetical protein